MKAFTLKPPPPLFNRMVLTIPPVRIIVSILVSIIIRKL